MKFGPTILALFVAASVAMLPMGATAAVTEKTDAPASMNMTSADMSAGMDTAAAMDVSECCPHEHPPCDKAGGGCTSMAACASTLLTLPAPFVSPFQFPPLSTQLIFPPASQVLSSQKSSPPFRPPRV